MLNGQPFKKDDSSGSAGNSGGSTGQNNNTCKYYRELLTSITNTDIQTVNINEDLKSDFLNVYISLPQTQMVPETDQEEGRESGRRIKKIRTRETSVRDSNSKEYSAQALLDSGCLIGDCISRQMLDKLNATHLIVYNDITICSGFDNNCSANFPTLIINISYLNERNSLREVFETKVFILPKTPIDIIIGRKTIKQQRFSHRVISKIKRILPISSK